MEFVDKVRAFLEFDVWGYIVERVRLEPKKRFSIFFYSLILIAFILDFYVIKGNFSFFSYTLIFGISIMLNEKKFYKIDSVVMWEFVLGLLIIISSFTIVTPIKWHFVPNTKPFGVFNGGIFIIGYFISFYGIRRYRIVFPFLIFYGSLVTLNGTWGFVVNDFAEKHIAPVSSELTYRFLRWLGYPVSISGTTITITTQSGEVVAATIAGACSGIEGMTLSAIMLIGLLIGSTIKYHWRLLIVAGASTIMFFINILRLSLTFIAAHYWGHEGLNLAHEWLGNIMFLVFILIYWHIIEIIAGGKINGSREVG